MDKDSSPVPLLAIKYAYRTHSINGFFFDLQIYGAHSRSIKKSMEQSEIEIEGQSGRNSLESFISLIQVINVFHTHLNTFQTVKSLNRIDL